MYILAPVKRPCFMNTISRGKRWHRPLIHTLFYLCVFMCTLVWVHHQPCVQFLGLLTTQFLEERFLTRIHRLPITLNWLSSEPQGFTCLPSTGITSMSHPSHSMQALRTEFRTWPLSAFSVSSPLYLLVLCVNLTQVGVITEQGASVEEVSP